MAGLQVDSFQPKATVDPIILLATIVQPPQAVVISQYTSKAVQFGFILYTPSPVSPA